MYTANGSTADDAWAYAVGGTAATTEGIGDVTNVGFNLYNYSSSLYAGSFSTVAFLAPLTINGADIWKATGPGNNLTWTRITGNGFGDTKVVEAGAFTEFYRTLYVALSTTIPGNFPGEELPGAGGAKIYRMASPPVTPVCGNGIKEEGEECETSHDCISIYGTGWACNDCQCQNATLITLSSFEAIPGSGKVTLQWTTESEVDNAGFNLYRAEAPDGPYVKINSALIPAKGSATQGTTYEYVDSGLKNRTTYYYKLEDIDQSGTVTMHGPKEATPRFLYMFEVQ
jgi:hypothetical protein